MEPTKEGRPLREAREAAGLTLGDASYLARQQLDHVRCSHETIRAYETETPEEKWTPEVVLALSRVYGVSLDSLSPVAAKRLSNVLVLMGRGPDESAQNLKYLKARAHRSAVRPTDNRPRAGGPNRHAA